MNQWDAVYAEMIHKQSTRLLKIKEKERINYWKNKKNENKEPDNNQMKEPMNTNESNEQKDNDDNDTVDID